MLKMNTKTENIEFGVSNAIATDNAPDGPWLRLAEYGDWPHSRGMQRFSRRSAERLATYFKSLRGRMARRFGGLPVYIGHPDDPGFSGKSGHDDTRAYAWIVDMEARHDGLYILPRWSDQGRELLKNAFYKFLSPRWAMRPMGEGIFEPTRLISVGLTNLPNIPGDAIANESPSDEPVDEKLLGDGKVARASDESVAAHSGEDGISSLETARLKAENAFKHERRERITLLLEQALRDGRIAANDRDVWQSGLEANFDVKLEELCSAEPAFTTEFISNGLGVRKSGTGQGTDFLTLVNERVQDDGIGFAEAWNQLKRERPDLFELLCS